MPEHLNVVPEEYRRAAMTHRETAEQLSAVPHMHDDLLVSLESLGPVFSEFKEAGRELLEQRRICYEQQALAHQELANRLEYAATLWENQDADAARKLAGLPVQNVGDA